MAVQTLPRHQLLPSLCAIVCRPLVGYQGTIASSHGLALALLSHCSLCTYSSFSSATICAASSLGFTPSMPVNTTPLYTLSTWIGYHCSACSRDPRNRSCSQLSFARTTCLVDSSLKNTQNLLLSRGLRLISLHLTSLVVSCRCKASSIHCRIFPSFSTASACCCSA